jgi:hypothetical protein
MRKTFLIAAVALGLTACSVEESQELHSSNAEQGASSYQGTGTNFVAKGWTAGDRRSWEQSLKVRLQQGQNEYNKVN